MATPQGGPAPLHLPATDLADGLVALADVGRLQTARWVALLARHRLIDERDDGESWGVAAAADDDYVSDLGLRLMQAPVELLDLQLAQLLPAGLAAALDRVRVRHEALDHASARVARIAGDGKAAASFDWSQWVAGRGDRPGMVDAVLHWYVNALGSWADARAIAEAVVAVQGQSSSPAAGRLLASCAAVLAAHGDVRCRGLFAQAQQAAPSAWESCLVVLRAAVAEVKRLPDATPASIDVALAAARAAADRPLARAGVGAVERGYAQALIENLSALVALRARDRVAARRRIERAWRLLSRPRSTRGATLPDQFVDELRIQILANVGVMAGMSDGWNDDAADIFAEAVEIARRQRRLSFTVEACALHGYALLQAGRPGDAGVVLKEADDLAKRGISPVQQRQVWKLRAVVADEVGDQQLAGRMLARLNT